MIRRKSAINVPQNVPRNSWSVEVLNISSAADSLKRYRGVWVGITNYKRTDTTACYSATYQPSFNVFVQGRKRVTFCGTTGLCNESTFLLTPCVLPKRPVGLFVA